MIFQNYGVWIADSIPIVLIYICLVLLFGHLFYLGVSVFKIKDKSEEYERNFYLLSLLIGFLFTLVILFGEFVFFILMFSPLFGKYLPLNLMNAVMSTNLSVIVADIVTRPIGVLIVAVAVIIIIVAINSLIMLELLKVNYLWTTILTWFAIGLYFAIDVACVTMGSDNGFAGVLGAMAAAVRSAIPV